MREPLQSIIICTGPLVALCIGQKLYTDGSYLLHVVRVLKVLAARHLVMLLLDEFDNLLRRQGNGNEGSLRIESTHTTLSIERFRTR